MSELNDRIRAALDDQPVVDVHSHLGFFQKWQARHLADLLSYHWVAVELERAAGEPVKERAEEDLDGFVEAVAPYVSKIRNTSNHYALMGILRDLYGVEDRTVTPENWKDINARVRERAGDATWIDEVLAKAGVEKISVTYTDVALKPNPRFFAYALGEPLYAIDGEARLRQADDRPIKKEARMKAMVDADRALPATARALEEIIVKRVKWLHEAHDVRALHVWPRESWRYRDHTTEEVSAALEKLSGGEGLGQEEMDVLQSFSADTTAREAGKYGMVVQLFHGSTKYGKTSCVANTTHYDPAFFPHLAKHLARNPGTRFDSFLGTRVPSHEVAQLSRVNKNLMVSGAWWHAFSPTTMNEFFRDRLEMLPMNAWNAFYSDGYIVEWVYGKLLVTKNRLAKALADMVEEGWLVEDDCADIACHVLYENPKEAYGL